MRHPNPTTVYEIWIVKLINSVPSRILKNTEQTPVKCENVKQSVAAPEQFRFPQINNPKKETTPQLNVLVFLSNSLVLICGETLFIYKLY